MKWLFGGIFVTLASAGFTFFETQNDCKLNAVFDAMSATPHERLNVPAQELVNALDDIYAKDGKHGVNEAFAYFVVDDLMTVETAGQMSFEYLKCQ